MRRCEDGRWDEKWEGEMWKWRWKDVKIEGEIIRCEDEMRRCEDEKMWWKDVMKRCDKSPLLEEAFAQRLSGKMEAFWNKYRVTQTGQHGWEMFFTIEPHFVRKGCRQFYISFWRSNLISCERVATLENHNFTSVFGDRTSFRAKRLHFMAPRWHCPPP